MPRIITRNYIITVLIAGAVLLIGLGLWLVIASGETANNRTVIQEVKDCGCGLCGVESKEQVVVLSGKAGKKQLFDIQETIKNRSDSNYCDSAGCSVSCTIYRLTI